MTSLPWSMLMIGWAVLALAFTLLWLLERFQEDASPVDVGWTLALGGLACWYAWASSGLLSRRILLATLVGVWSVRLAGHLIARIARSEEDGRYRRMRSSWGPRAHIYFFVFYQAQALLAVILSFPFLIIATHPRPNLHPLEIGGALLWLGALLGEGIADRQLAAFRSDAANAGNTCRRGLWRYSRHPNYFFEWLTWVAYGLIALAAPSGPVGFLSAAIMLFLVLKVTGIPPAEEQALFSRGEDYRDYQKTTSAFVPWFPRR